MFHCDDNSVAAYELRNADLIASYIAVVIYFHYFQIWFLFEFLAIEEDKNPHVPAL